MKILVIATYHYQGSLFPTAIFMHEQMLAYARAGHDVRALVLIPWGKKDDFGHRFGPAVCREDVDGVEHIFLRQFSFSKYGIHGLNQRCCLVALKKHTAETLNGWHPDVIHAQAIGNIHPGLYLQKKTGAPLVATDHGETLCDEPWKSRPDMILPTVDLADAVFGVSSHVERQLRRLGAKTRLGTILNGFSVQNIAPAAEKPPYSIIQVGFLQSRKKADVTIRALAKLRESYPGAALELIGTGSAQERFQKLSQDLGVGDAVQFRGYLTNPETLSAMSRSRFFVMASVDEGFGLVYAEAMASGCITIGTEGEGIADLIVSGENGFLVPPDDPEAIVKIITWCVEHPQEADRIAERGRRDALGLTWDKNAAQYIQLFETLREERTRCE